MHRYARNTLIWLTACALWACGSIAHEPVAVEPKPAEQQAPPVPAEAPPPAPVAAPAVAVRNPSEWDKLKLEDESPLCVFANHTERELAPYLRDVRKQTLRADERLVFGTFPPGCISGACDAVPTHQCWVESETPNTLVVHSRLSFEHKHGSVCTTDCARVIAGCETPVLKAGKYSVKYGQRTFSVRVPSVMRAPCFKLQ
jgi:hypothetical protein